jgi:hypothetical protein
MPTPFPGMDPYLERPGLWVQVHASLIIDIQRFLIPLLRPRYHVAIEQHTYLTVWPPYQQQSVGIPDVLITLLKNGTYDAAITVPVPAAVVHPVVGELPLPEEGLVERYLEVREVTTQEVITMIEVLSPTNKILREGRLQYQRKRHKVLNSLTHLVEIDLLRAGKPLPMAVTGQNDYRMVVSRSPQRPQADVYLFGIRDPIPDLPIPLRTGETEPTLPLNQILHNLYDLGGYDLAINYRQPPDPPLKENEAPWMAQLLNERN